jgi:hypothetical protein
MASLIEDSRDRDRSVGMKKAADEAAMASLMEDPEAVGKTSEETPEKAAAEKKREKNRRKKAKQKAKKKETALAAEQSTQRALDNKKAEEDDEWNEYPTSKVKTPPILSMMGVMPVINKATWKKQKEHTKAVPTTLPDGSVTYLHIPKVSENMTITDAEYRAMSPAQQNIAVQEELNIRMRKAMDRNREGWNPNSPHSSFGGYKKRRKSKRRKRRKTKRKRKSRRKTRKRKRKTRRKTKRRR